jgi:peptidoglycan/LPS O-acetylase OafA/YrhL
MSAAQGSDRLHGLDAVRGYALMLGIVYHATMAYLPGPAIWPVADAHKSLLLSGLFFVSHIFRMSTFFLIAGFFGHMVVERRGVAAFVKDRAKRIALPLVVGWPIVLAAILGAAVYGGVMMTGHVPPRPPPEAHPPLLAFPLTHLWFLYVLLWLYAATLTLRAVVLRLDTSGRFRARADAVVASLAESQLAPVILALPAMAAFLFGGPWRQWFGVTTPDSSLIPNVHAAVQYFTAFGFGWLLHRQPGLINTWVRRWPLNLSLAVGLTAACLAMAGVAPYLGLAQPGLKTIAYAFAYTVAMWSWTFAVIGLALKFLSGESPARRYIADSSYWLYLIHLPLVMALQAMVVRLEWPAEAKMIVVLGIAFPLMFASYELMVRHSFIGAILNGRRAPRAAKPARLTAQPETR